MISSVNWGFYGGYTAVVAETAVEAAIVSTIMINVASYLLKVIHFRSVDWVFCGGDLAVVAETAVEAAIVSTMINVASLAQHHSFS